MTPAPEAAADDLEPLQRGSDGFRQFSVRYRLPWRVEVQHVPEGRMDAPDR